MANKKINELSSRTPALSDLMIVGDPSSGYSYKCTVTALATIIETDIADGYVTIGTTQTISGAKTFSNNLTLTSVVNTPTDPDKFLTLNASNVVTYRTGAEVLSDIGGQAALSGTGIVKSTGGTISYLTDNSSNWNTAYDNMIVSAAVTGTTTKTLTLTQQDAGTITASWTDINTDAVTSVFGRTGAVVATEGDYTLTQLGDVTITTPSTGQVLKYNGTIWVNDTDANTGTVTSVALSTGTTGTDISVSGSPITSSGTITLNIPTASATNRGALSSTDWTTFNNKQNALTLTTTGTSGAATLVGSTLNIPQYQGVLTNPVTGTGTTNYIPKFTSSSAIGNSLLTDNGIELRYTGADGLRVQGSTDGFLSVYGTANNYLQFIDGGGASGYIRYNHTSDFMSFQTAGSERMRLDASGNLGLGTSNPLNLLHISQASANTIFRLGNNSAYDQFIYFNGANDWSLGMDYSNSNAFVLSNASSIGTNDRLVVTTSGNLGLGVSPSAWSNGQALQVTSAALWGFNNNAHILANAYYNSGFKYLANGVAALYEQNTGQHIWYNAPSGTAGNAISFTQAMTLDASGRLGIGTTTITAPLTVAGTSDLAWTASTSKLQISRSGSVARLQNYESGSAASLSLQWDGGNVGIGTTSPNHLLQVTSSSNFGAALKVSDVSTQSTGAIALGDGSTSTLGIGMWRAAENSYTTQGNWLNIQGISGIAFMSGTGAFGSNTERMTITSGGNVGIGTSSPSSVNGVALQVYDASTPRIRLTNSTTGITSTDGAEFSLSSSLFIIENRENDNIAFYTNGGRRMDITSSGELLINTTSDAGDYKLQVAGNSLTRGLVIDGANNGNTSQFAMTRTDQSWGIFNETNLRVYTSSSNTTSPSTKVFEITTPGNVEIPNGSIKTAAPSGGTAKPWKLGEAGVTLGGSNTSGVRVEIDGVVYYLVTGYLP